MPSTDKPAVELRPRRSAPNLHEYFLVGTDTLHRDDGPARLHFNTHGTLTTEWWYQYGELHRTDGPAFIHRRDDGSIWYEDWYLHGNPLTPEEVTDLKILLFTEQVCPTRLS